MYIFISDHLYDVRYYLTYILFFVFGQSLISQPAINTDIRDSIWRDQVLFNGTLWYPGRNLARGHEFFISPEWFGGSLTITGVMFNDIRLRYDIFSDNIIVPSRNSQPIIPVKEHIDGFTINYNGRVYSFMNLGESHEEVKGFVEILYHGENLFVAKNSKVILKGSTSVSYEQYDQRRRYYLIMNDRCFPVTSRQQFYGLLGDKKQLVRKYERQNKLFVSIINPESFIPLIIFYESLLNQPTEP